MGAPQWNGVRNCTTVQTTIFRRTIYHRFLKSPTEQHAFTFFFMNGYLRQPLLYICLECVFVCQHNSSSWTRSLVTTYRPSGGAVLYNAYWLPFMCVGRASAFACRSPLMIRNQRSWSSFCANSRKTREKYDNLIEIHFAFTGKKLSFCVNLTDLFDIYYLKGMTRSVCS